MMVGKMKVNWAIWHLGGYCLFCTVYTIYYRSSAKIKLDLDKDIVIVTKYEVLVIITYYSCMHVYYRQDAFTLIYQFEYMV